MIRSLDDLSHDPKNANKHTKRGAAMMESALQEVGFADSMTVSSDGVVLSGNQRLDTAGALQMENPIIIESDGTRPIVHVRTDIVSTDPKAAKLSLYANRVGEVNLAWDETALASVRQDVDLSSLFEQHELVELGVEAPIVAEVSIDHQGRLDQKSAVTCPHCGATFILP